MGLAQLHADFNTNNTSGCPPLTINYTDATAGSPTSYFWDFGNGNTSTSTNPSAIYIKPGTYTVKLVVRDGTGLVDSIERLHYVTVFKGPSASASTSKRTACVGETIFFKDLSTKGDGDIVSWKWDFGDGTISNNQNPSHIYKSGGTYTIRLITTDKNGCESTATLTSHIVINAAPVSDFSISAPTGCKAPHQTNFSAVNTNGTTYNWNFGDGKGATGKTPSHTYTAMGTYQVTLEVIDNLGCKSETTKTVTVKELTPGLFVSSKKVCIGEFINFVGSSTPSFPTAVYDWKLGDGRQVRGSAFSHNYKSAGTYTVSVTVSASGCTGSADFVNIIEVRENPKIEYSVSDTILCDRKKPIVFKDLSKNISKRKWNFSNGTFSTISNKSIIFDNGGTYNYSLEVEDALGCKNTINGHVKVSEVRADYITGEITSDSFINFKTGRKRPVYGKCTPYPINLKENSYSVFKLESIFWDLGNKTSSSKKEVNPNYTLVDSIHHGWLWAQDIYGCKDSIDFYVQLGDSTFPSFIPDKKIVCNGDTIHFKNYSRDSAKITKYQWSFGSSAYEPKQAINQVPDTMPFKLTTYHHNCKNDTSVHNFIVLGPYGRIIPKYNPCSVDSIWLKSDIVKADSIEWVNGNGVIISNGDSVLVPGTSNRKYYLYTWNKNGCSYKDSIIVKLKEVIKLDYEFPEVLDCAPVQTDFSYSPSTPGIVSWSFNGKDTFMGENIKYNFEKAGPYAVKLMVKGDNGCTSSKTGHINIRGVVVNGDVVAKDTCLPFNITLVDSLYTPNSFNKFFWVINETDTIHHTDKKTNYTLTTTTANKIVSIKLVGTDLKDCHSSQTFKVFASGPYADVKHYPSYLCDSIHSTINLLNKTKDITFISWKYEGQEISSTSNLSYYFPYNKKHDVSVKLVNTEGCQAIYKQEVFSKKLLNAHFTSDTTGSFCPPLEVYFKDSSTSTKPIVEYQWDFGDGTGSFLKDPGKLYLVPGKYTVSLTVTDNEGCKSTKISPDFILVNGPTGSYSFSPNEGCTPLEVTFNSVSNNASIIKWDLGDGVVLNGASQKLTYDRLGQYIPLLILEDIYGCSYSMPPIDTINVRGYPKSEFTVFNKCLGETSYFVNQSNDSKGKIISNLWDFGDGTTSDSTSVNHVYQSNKNHTIQLITTNEYGCSDTLKKNINFFNPIANFDAVKDQYCLGEYIEIKNNSTSDTVITEYNWELESIGTANTEDPQIVLSQVGNFKFKLNILDAAGCKDSFESPIVIRVGDSTAPQPPLLLRASVLNDNAIDITFADNPISDFYRLELFRETSPGNFIKVSESTDPTDTVLYDYGVNTLHQSHCFIVNKENFCFKKKDHSELIKHCTVEATATGRLNAIELDWNPYIGWNEVDSYFVYREEILIPDSFTKIAQVDGNTFSYIDTTIHCREELFYKILAKQKSNATYQLSWSDSTGAKPIYQNEVPPNEIWRTTVIDDAYTGLEWLPIKNNRFPIAYYKIQVKEGDKGFKELDTKFSPTTTNIDYKKTEVDDFNYHFQMYAVDVCDDVSPLSIPAKTVLLKVDVNQEFRPELSWTTYQGWNEGVEEYVIEMEDEFGNFGEIGRVAATDTHFVDYVSPFNCIEKYCYRITAIRNQPDKADSSFSVISHSNVSCAPVVSKIYVPNAFTINADGLNDDFVVKGIYIKEYNIKIFNRWGEKVYESNSFKEHWDGTFAGQNASQGVFVYLIEAKGVDNKLYHLSGDVTLLR